MGWTRNRRDPGLLIFTVTFMNTGQVIIGFNLTKNITHGLGQGEKGMENAGGLSVTGLQAQGNA